MTNQDINLIHDFASTTGQALRPAGYRFTPATTMTVSELDIWTMLAGHTVKGALHAVTAGILGAKIGGDSQVANTVAGGVVTLALSSPALLTGGVEYAVDLCFSTSASVIGSNSASSQNRYNSTALASMASPLPDPFASLSTTGSNKFPYLVLRSTAPTISSIDQCITGQVSTINYSESFAATSASISDTVVTKTFALTASDADTSTGTIPQWVDGQTAVKIVAVNITATNGTVTTAPFVTTLSMDYFHPDDATVVAFTAITLTSVSPDSLSVVAGFSPPWIVDTQVLYDSTRFTVGLDGVVSGNYTGVSYMWDRDPDDQIARLTTITTQDGEIVSATRGFPGSKVTGGRITGHRLTGSSI